MAAGTLSLRTISLMTCWVLSSLFTIHNHTLATVSSQSCLHSVGGSSLLLLATEFTSLDAGGGGELDVLLGRDTDHEGRDVDHLLTDSDVLLSDEDASVVHGVGDLSLHDEGLETTFHELGNGETKDVIELSLRLLEETETDHAGEEGLTFEDSAGVVGGQGEQDSCGLSKLGKGQLKGPDFSLVLEAVSADESQPKRTRTS